MQGKRVFLFMSKNVALCFVDFLKRRRLEKPRLLVQICSSSSCVCKYLHDTARRSRDILRKNILDTIIQVYFHNFIVFAVFQNCAHLEISKYLKTLADILLACLTYRRFVSILPEFHTRAREHKRTDTN